MYATDEPRCYLHMTVLQFSDEGLGLFEADDNECVVANGYLITLTQSLVLFFNAIHLGAVFATHVFNVDSSVEGNNLGMMVTDGG